MYKAYAFSFWTILLVAFLYTPSLTIASALEEIGGDSRNIATSSLISLTNKERTKLSLPELKNNTRLEHAAQMKAEDMASKQYFSHDTPNKKKPWYWFNKAGYNFVYAGENLAMQFTEANEVEEAWMASPLHRANIVNKKYTDIGIGIATGLYNGSSTIYVVQLFGKEVR